MTEQGTVTLYHGTDIESASDIIQNGLNLDNLVRQQDGRPTQLGTGLYTTDQPGILPQQHRGQLGANMSLL